MGSIFITGSSDGIGQETARQLIGRGHRVVLHARDDRRARQARTAVPDAAGTVAGDLSVIAGIRQAAQQASALGPYDVVIHNAGVGGGPRQVTADGLERIFAVKVLAPYLLTALMELPATLLYVASGLAASGQLNLDDLQWERRRWDGMQAYSDSKLHDVMLAFALARRFPALRSNAIDPGWIKTKLGGAAAPGTLAAGAATPVWLACGQEPATQVTGRFFKGKREVRASPAACDAGQQEALLAVCTKLAGAALPG